MRHRIVMMVFGEVAASAPATISGGAFVAIAPSSRFLFFGIVVANSLVTMPPPCLHSTSFLFEFHLIYYFWN